MSEAIGIYGVHINSALVSAQNRKRIYWTNIRTRQEGLFGELHSDIPQPNDEGILLKDILEKDVAEKYYLSDKMLNYFDKRAANFNNGKVNIRSETDKATTLCASMSSCDISDNFVLDTKLKPKENQTKSNCFTAGGNSGGLHSDMDLICVSMVGRKTDENGVRKDNDPNIKAVQRLEPAPDNKTNCLTTVAKDNLIACLTPKRTEFGKKIRKQYEAGEVSAMRKEVSQLEPREDGKTNTLTTVQKDNLIHNDYRIRRLTPTECAALQTVPKWYKWACSDTQIYRMCGNGWTIKVIMHILSFL